MNRNLNSVAAVPSSARVPRVSASPDRTLGVSPRRTFIVFTLLVSSVYADHALAQKISLVGGTVINPADGKQIENAVVVINGGRIESVSSRKESGVPVGSKWVECDNKFFLRGYIDMHVHFFQSCDLFSRPDGEDYYCV